MSKLHDDNTNKVDPSLDALCPLRSWINSRQTSDKNENGVKSFLDFAKTHAFDSSGRSHSPCFGKYGNILFTMDFARVRQHRHGMCVDNNTSVQTDELGFTFIDLDNVAKQMFYVNDLSNKRSMHGSDENQYASLDLTDTPSFSTHMPTFND
ncbi:hypothetical protein CR513_33881, partial [Mucuna pruriens]